MTLDDIRDRIAEMLGWSREDVDKFSLPQLRAFVRNKDKRLDRCLTDLIESKQHWFTTEPKCKAHPSGHMADAGCPDCPEKEPT